MKNKDNKMIPEKKKKRKALIISFVIANLLMLAVIAATHLFQIYLYNQLATVSTVQILSNPVHIAIGYVVGTLLLFAIIYRYETKEPEKLSDELNQNHNIY